MISGPVEHNNGMMKNWETVAEGWEGLGGHAGEFWRVPEWWKGLGGIVMATVVEVISFSIFVVVVVSICMVVICFFVIEIQK